MLAPIFLQSALFPIIQLSLRSLVRFSIKLRPTASFIQHPCLSSSEVLLRLAPVSPISFSEVCTVMVGKWNLFGSVNTKKLEEQ